MAWPAGWSATDGGSLVGLTWQFVDGKWLNSCGGGESICQSCLFKPSEESVIALCKSGIPRTEAEVTVHIRQARRRFPNDVVEYFGRYRQTEVEAAIEAGITRGAIVEKWFDDRACGGTRYRMLKAPGVE